jgi:hypothetical protein
VGDARETGRKNGDVDRGRLRREKVEGRLDRQENGIGRG